MPSEFDQELIDTAAEFLTAFGEAEKGTYYPYVGGSREITAIVNRPGPAGLEGAPHGSSPKLSIVVANNATTGISSDEVNEMKDEYKVAVRIGEAAQRKLITKILAQDAGMMELELR